MSKALRFVPFSIALAEGGALPKRVQLLKAGTFHTDNYGTFKITPAYLKKLADNHAANVRGVDIAIDFAHDNQREAAAWIKALSVENDGTELWADVEWTTLGAAKVAGKEFRYLSAEFTDNYVDNETQKKFGPTLLGAGLTNRPAIKGMKAAIELSERKGVSKMNEEELKAALETEKAKSATLETKLSAVEAKLATTEASVTSLTEEKKLSEKKLGFAKLLSEGKAVPAQEQAFLEGDMVKFAELAGPVQTKPAGHGGEGKKDETVVTKDAETQVLELAEGLVKSDKLSLSDAVSRVLSEKPELAKAYAEKGI